MRFDIRYTSRFEYGAPVSESQNELRACPTSDARQQLSHYRVVTRPSSRSTSYHDYWGTRVDTFGIRAEHELLEVVAECTVETSAAPHVVVSPSWEQLADVGFRDDHLEYLAPSAHVSWDDAIEGEARQIRKDSGDDVVGAVLAIHRLIGHSYAYSPGVTYVGVTCEEVFKTQQGVCQDFAHLVVAMCRSIGVPARYVSGYLFAVDGTAGETPADDEIDVQTHAWVEAAIPGHGWMGLDPTNRQQVGVRHVKIGHGRDYDDVAPLKGAYIGAASHKLSATVHMRRMAQQQQQQ